MQTETKALVPSPALAKYELHQYILEELIKKLQAARGKGGMVGERCVVTMLFCDLKGSTAAAEGLDPENWTEIMNGVFAQMIKPLFQYEGTIARLMGDALLAFFGAPIAHEDDPRRAILAGLDIVQAIKPYREKIRENYGVDFDVRVGINTGLVVVGAVGSDLRMEYSALAVSGPIRGTQFTCITSNSCSSRLYANFGRPTLITTTGFCNSSSI